MRPAFNQPPTLQNANAVASDDGAEAVGHDDGRWALLGHEQRVDAPLDDHFALAVERTRCLVEQHDPGLPDQAARDAEALPLAAAELHGRHADAD